MQNKDIQTVKQQVLLPSYRKAIEYDIEQEKILVSTISDEQFALKDLIQKIGLKHRPAFLENYINFAIKNGLV